MNKIFAVGGVVVKELIRRKDFYVLFFLTSVITLLLAVNDERYSRYLKEVCLLLIWISSLVIAITTTARQIPVEKESRTIFPLLAKPVSRSQVLLGKFVGCWVASGAALLIFYTFFALVGAIRGNEMSWVGIIQALWLHWQALGIVIAVTLLGSLVMSAPAPNVTVVFIFALTCLYLVPNLHKLAMRLTEPGATIVSALYFALPHLEFFDVRDLVVHDWPAVAWTDVGLATLYGATYMAFFLFAACLIFRRKALN